MSITYPKGSEWRKWDLHVHTPASQGYKGTYEELVTSILNSDVAVIGINDYFSVDGYAELMTNYTITGKTLIPVVEMRMNNTLAEKDKDNNGARFNFHIIFNNNLPVEQIKNFLIALPIKDKNGKNNLLGNITDKEDIEKITVNFSDVVNKLKELQLFMTNALIWIPYDEYGGIDKIDPNDNFFKLGLINDASILGSSSQKQIDFFNWNDGKHNEEWFKEKLGKKTPCIKGSDCHKAKYPIGKLMDGNSKPIDKFCWIKADPTFEGLKQIIYEPDSRIAIGAEPPDDKKPYNTIDKIRFIDNRDPIDFGAEYIEVNQNLNTIIGGKSSGKSLLLYYMATVIDNNEVESRIASKRSVAYTFDEDKNFDFEVVWKDGTKQTLRDTSRESKKILYIPQNYLNYIADNNPATLKDLNKFVLDVIFQNKLIAEQYAEISDEINKINNEITSTINLLYTTKNEGIQLSEALKKLGDKTAIEKYILELNKKLDAIKKAAGLSAEDIKTYKELLENKQNLDREKSNVLNDKKQLTQLFATVRTMSKDIHIQVNDYLQYFNDKNLKAEVISTLLPILPIDDVIEKRYLEVDAKVLTRMGVLEKQEKEISAKLEPLLNKVKLRKDIDSITANIAKESEKLETLTKLSKEREIKRNKYKELCEKLVERYFSLYKKHIEAIAELKKGEANLDDIKLNIKITLDTNRFSRFINEYINKTDLKKELKINTDIEYVYTFIEEEHQEYIKNVFEGIILGKIKSKGHDEKDCIFKLFDDYFDIDISITYLGDQLSKMSPGKKALVILKLLIELSEEKYPILLDQPEDDLDNRSIYLGLVSFIKEKKKERQIIIVTHNPNLVVGADSEEVIVANQEGQDIGRDNQKYRFEYISGALENTFKDPSATGVLYSKGIRENVCEILEGGEEAFTKREQKYSLTG